MDFACAKGEWFSDRKHTSNRTGGITMLGGQILHGGDYNPDQWLDCPEVLEEDVRLMKEANVNCVSLGIFAWAALEPEEGRYEFDWLEKIIDRLGEEGIQVVLATPSGAMPHWLTQKYPETMQVQADGKRNLPGKRHNFCYTSPVMREKIYQIDSALSERFGRKENVILWHLSNELGGNFADSSCHCELCQEAFRNWLKEKYGTLDNLNRAYWSTFWSHTYTDWSQLHSPAPHGETTMTALTLDWKRFVTYQMSDFVRTETAAVRTHSDLPLTTNFMYFFKGLDYGKMRDDLDIISWDNYPFWHKTKDEVPVAVRAAANHNIMRSLKKQPFLLMESTPSAVSWREFNPIKRPGMHMLSSMQAIAHGSDSVQYFQWRKGRGAYEKFHGAVVDHKNGSNTRTFRQVTELGERLRNISGLVDGTVNRPKAAMIFDWENWWALEDASGPRLDISYIDCILDHYQAFWEAGIDTDFLNMDDSLEGYAVVAAPLNYMYKPGYAEKVRRFVEGGGIYVTTYFSGIVDDTDLCFTGHHPLADVLGLEQEEIDAPSGDFPNSFRYGEKQYPAGSLRELIHASEETKVHSVYEEDYVKGEPVVTEHRYGKGAAWYIAAEPDMEFLRSFYGDRLKEAGVQNALGTDLPYGVTVAERMGSDGRSLVFVMNFRNEAVTVRGTGKWADAESERTYDGSMTLGAFECLVLRK